ncbi:MAG: nucleoside 2-deoxyribosyltransferase [Erysipelotrichaceae bacterium]|nr:nucleoside 2-deoxyribosyltransferase [Erysipelotrichaceae bacterium]
MNKLKVYLSGPDRLRKDAKHLFEKKKELCVAYGFELLEYPEDLYRARDSFENSRNVANKRLELIRNCDILIADCKDFRSYVEPYSECALEMGIAYGFDKKVYAYMPDARVCQERYSGEKKYNEEAKRWEDKDGISFEPGPLNLMLEYGSTVVEGDLETALNKIKADLEGRMD